MRPQQRQRQIIDLVHSEGKVSVERLAREFAISAETIRRDLTSLAAGGKIRKIHGGAMPLRLLGEDAFAKRMQANVEAKRQIAGKARQLLSPGATIFIDTGSTTVVMAETLATTDDLTIITNSTSIAHIAGSTNESNRVYLLGGAYNEDNRQTCGSVALEQLQGFHADLALLTVGAIGADNGVMDYNFDEAGIARAMISLAERVIVLADASKFDRSAPFVVASFERIDTLVCDRPPAGMLAQRLEQAGVAVL